MSDYQAKLARALETTYDLNTGRTVDGTQLRGELRYTLDQYGQPQELISGHPPVTGFELVRRMELAYASIKRLEAGIAEHRRLLGDAMKRAEQQDAESIGEDTQ